MLRFMAFFFVLSFVLLMSGLVEIALVAFGLAVATPCAYIAWAVLAPVTAAVPHSQWRQARLSVAHIEKCWQVSKDHKREYIEQRLLSAQRRRNRRD